ncbi:WD40 repeat, conserved site [Phytophthora cactorum]|nr:WD40 repeat, conserved site [Phytophthora cactorum]
MLTVTDEISEDTEKVTTEDIESIVKEEDEAPPAEPNWNHEKIYDVLQALPEPPKVEGMDIHEAHEKMSPAEFRKQIVTLWKKRQAELKEALESLQDDAKYLGKLLEQFKEAEEKGDAEGQLSVLEVLEWEVQDLDKTHVFNFIGGFGIVAEYLNSTNLPVLLFVYDLLAEATEIKLRGGEDPAPFALIELEKVFQSEEWCQRFSTTFVKMAHLLAHREVIELVDAMQHQLPTCQKVHQASGVKTVVERLAKGFADDEELDAEEKKELALFFEDFLGHQSERTPLQSDRSSKMRGTSTKAAPEPLGVLRGHGAPVNSVGFLSVSTVVSGAGDGAVKIWDLKSRRELATNPAAHSKAGVLHTAALQGAAASEHKYVTQGRDGFVKLWDAQTFGIAAEPLSKLYCGSYSFTKSSTMRWPGDTPEGAHVIVCPSSVDNKLLVYDIREDSSSPALTLTVPDAAAKRGMCVSLSLFGSSVAQVEDGAGGNVQTYIAAGFEGGQLAILDLRSGGKVACETTVTQGANALLSFDVTRDGRSAICGSSGEELYVANIDVASYTLSSRSFFSCAHGGFSNVCIRGDQRIVATAGWDHRVRVFHLRKLKPLAVLKYHSDSVFALDFSADSALLASSQRPQNSPLVDLSTLASRFC